MANDGTVKIGTDLDESGFKSGLSKLGKAAGTALKGTVSAIGGVATAATGAVTAMLALESATEEYRIAQGKLNTAFEAAGYGPEVASQAYTEFYKILGDTDTATEAAQLLATLAESEEDVSTWTNIAAGVFGTFGDSLPIEGLIEAANETAKVGTVTGVLADALNWAGISEDEFNLRLAECSSESERNRLIMDTLAETYDEASEAFQKNNETIIRARENQALLDETLSALGETVSSVKNSLLSEFLPSISQVISAFNDLINGAEGADEALSEAVQDMVTSLVEKLPDFLSFGVDVASAILEGLIQNIPQILDALVLLVAEIGAALVELAPQLIEAGKELLVYLADGLERGLPLLAEKLPQLLTQGIQYLTENMDSILELGVDIVNSLVNGIIEAIPILIESLPDLIIALVEAIIMNLPKIQQAGNEILINLVVGIIQALPKLGEAWGELNWAILEGLGNIVKDVVGIGADLVKGLYEGITNSAGWLLDQISGWADSIISAIKGFFDINSPSGETEYVGDMLDEGVAVGIDKNIGKIKSAIRRMDFTKELKSVLPDVQQRVHLATSSMAPAYSDPAAPQVVQMQSTLPQPSTRESSRPIVIRFDGSLAQLAQILTPYIDSEHNRLGEELA